jgi:hypothetical protein
LFADVPSGVSLGVSGDGADAPGGGGTEAGECEPPQPARTTVISNSRTRMQASYTHRDE